MNSEHSVFQRKVDLPIEENRRGSRVVVVRFSIMFYSHHRLVVGTNVNNSVIDFLIVHHSWKDEKKWKHFESTLFEFFKLLSKSSTLISHYFSEFLGRKYSWKCDNFDFTRKIVKKVLGEKLVEMQMLGFVLFFIDNFWFPEKKCLKVKFCHNWILGQKLTI